MLKKVMSAIDHVTVFYSVTLPLNGSEAGSDLVDTDVTGFVV